MPTPTILYSGGPLAGEQHEKSAPGRWPTYRDRDGCPVATSKVEKYRDLTQFDPENPLVVRHSLYRLTTTVPGKPGGALYTWLEGK